MTVAAARLEVQAPARRAVGWWLFGVALLVAAMVTLGGLTRLTGSGLSITEWNPVTGVVPPLTEQAWQAEFSNYQKIPQYRFENRGMTLGEFKSIYWWEWAHRLLGRLVGAAFLLPFIGFAATGAIPRQQWPRMLVLFALGGLQGAVGWWMVQSGLETRVSVSQYRLAIHLGVAILLLGALLWTAMEYLRPVSRAGAGRKLTALAWGLVAIVYVQMLLGAVVAGLHAGLIYNTWPSMNGRLLPEDAFAAHPWWTNFLDNPGLAQFDHRMVAYGVVAAAVGLWIAVRRADVQGRARTTSNALVAIVLVQVVLGIATLLNQVPLALAALHQAAAVAVFAAALWNAYEISGAAALQLSMGDHPR
ncbi:MAG TPA: COX15/CtaA family protein [Rhizomicrobium sp.]|jgi:cytochrome c oxidase assembly protein subunit 15|nr:COX15/CtaA family protein [Rhizomicrobium sp.]